MLSVSLMVPMVRVETRASLQLSNRGNLGVNPLVLNAGARGRTRLLRAIRQALASSTSRPRDVRLPRHLRGGTARRAGLRARCAARPCTAWANGSPFLPLDTSTAGQAIDTPVARIRRVS